MNKYIQPFLLMLPVSTALIMIGILFQFTLVYIGAGLTMASIIVMLYANIKENKSND